jgi:hypothetical protein
VAFGCTQTLCRIPPRLHHHRIGHYLEVPFLIRHHHHDLRQTGHPSARDGTAGGGVEDVAGEKEGEEEHGRTRTRLRTRARLRLRLRGRLRLRLRLRLRVRARTRVRMKMEMCGRRGRCCVGVQRHLERHTARGTVLR